MGHGAIFKNVAATWARQITRGKAAPTRDHRLSVPGLKHVGWKHVERNMFLETCF